jgi:hypothetical protein
MGKNDEVDRRRAAAFAWTFTRPGETIVLPDEENVAAPEKPVAVTVAPVATSEVAASEVTTGEVAASEVTTGEVAASEVAAAQVATGDVAAGEVATSPGVKPDSDTAASGENFFRAAAETCAAMSLEIDRIWLLPEAEQAGAVEPLLVRASELGLGLCAMQHFPLQSIRLLRLALRCRDAISPDVWEAAWTSAAWLDYNHAELLELLIEVAKAAESSLTTALMLAVSEQRWKTVGRMPGAIARLARVIDEGPGYAARSIAINWIFHIGSGGRAAVPALRRALREPHFVLRYHALDVLDEHFPDQIQAEDVMFLLEDTVRHAPPDRLHDEEGDRANHYLPRMLERAVVRLRPKGGVEPLIALIDGRCATRWHLAPGLDAPWALCVLAAAYPEHALPHIDRRLAHVSRDRREMAVEALTRLPDELARPRLVLAAADGMPEIAERAQAIWLERYAEICPRDPMAGVETSLLDGPPSETMRSRLDMLRTAPLEARAAMIEVLLGEAPDPEALALLLFVAIDSRIWERKLRPGLPEYRETFCCALFEGFGTRAIDGLLALEARFPEGRFGWFHALAGMLTGSKVKLPESTHPGLRATAARRLVNPNWRPDFDAVNVLAHIGPPLELADRLWRLARDPEQSNYFREVSVRALVLLPAGDGAGRLDAAVAAEMEAAFAVPDIPRFALAAMVGFGRKLALASELSERALARFGPARPEDPRVIEALTACFEALVNAGHLPATARREALGQPGTYLCAVAARHAQRRKIDDAEIAALQALLTSDDPACAAEAACVLLGHDIIAADRPGLHDIAARAPSAQRAELLFRMRMRGAAVLELWPLIKPLLTSPDPDVIEPLMHLTYELDKEGLHEELRELMPRVVHPDMHREIEDLFDREQDPYWDDYLDDEEEDD